MELSIFLAKVLGLYFLIVSVAVLINIDRVKSIVTGIMQNPPLQLIMGFNILVIGILLVVSHNNWRGGWPIVITIVAWLIFIKGILNVAFPQYANAWAKPFIKSKSSLYISPVIYLLVGLFLCYYGFLAR